MGDGRLMDNKNLLGQWIRNLNPVRLHLPEPSKENGFAHSPLCPFQDIPLWISNNRGWRSADLVTVHRFSRVRIVQVKHHRCEAGIDLGFHLLIRPDLAFHDSTGHAPLGGEVEDHGLAGLGGLLLSRGVVFGPGDVVGGNVEIVIHPDEGDWDGAEPEPAPKVEPAAMGE